MKSIPMTELRNRLSELGDPSQAVVLTRHGHPVAVVLSLPEDPEDRDNFLIYHDPAFQEMIRESRKAGFVSAADVRHRIEAKQRHRGRSRSAN